MLEKIKATLQSRKFWMWSWLVAGTLQLVVCNWAAASASYICALLNYELKQYEDKYGKSV